MILDAVDYEQGPDWSALRKYRVERLVQAMKAQGLDGVMFTRLDAVRYITSFRPVYSMWFYGNRYVVLVTADGHIRFLVASGDYARVQATMPWLTDIVSFPFEMTQGAPLIVEGLNDLGLGTARVGLDIMPYGVLELLTGALPQLQLVDGLPALEEARRIKHDVEIDMLRGAAYLADTGMRAALGAIRDGAVEQHVSAAAVKAMMEEGSEDAPYYPLVESGPHQWLKYRFPTMRHMRAGEMVWIDCGACIFNGYNGDIARIAVVDGRSTPEQRRIYQTIHRMLMTVQEMATAGTHADDLVSGVNEVVKEAGYEAYSSPVILGHGIGTDLHEAPAIGDPIKAPGADAAKHEPVVLERNMVISCEPGIIVPGIGGGHLENMMLISDGPAEILTKTPFEESMLE